MLEAIQALKNDQGVHVELQDKRSFFAEIRNGWLYGATRSADGMPNPFVNYGLKVDQVSEFITGLFNDGAALVEVY